MAATDATAANVAIAKTLVDEVLTKGNLGALDAITDPAIVGSNAGDAPGPDAFKSRIKRFFQFVGYAVKDAKYTTETVVASGADVIVRGYITGASNDGKTISATYFIQLTINAGLISGAWYAYDAAAVNGL